MNRTRKFLYNTTASIIYQIVVIVVGFIIPKLILTHYGSDVNGLISSITQFITYFSLVEAGLAGAATYSLYKPLSDKNYDKVSSIVSAAKTFYIKSGWIFTILIIVMSTIYPVFITLEGYANWQITFLIFILGAKGFLDFFTLSKYRVLLTADQKNYVVSLASIIYLLLQLIIMAGLIFLNFNLIIVYFIAIAALFVRSIILYVYVKRNYKEVKFNAEPDNKALSKRWDALFLQILGVVQRGLPIIFATIFVTLKEVSVFSVYNMVLTGINGLLTIFISGISAAFGELLVNKNHDKVKRVYDEFELVYYVGLSIVFCTSLVMLLPFVELYTSGITDINYSVPLIADLFVLNGLLYNLKTPQGMMVIAGGLYRETRYQTLTQALIIVILGAILGYNFGLVGILIATCLSNLYRVIDLLFFVPKNILKCNIYKTLKRLTIIILTFILVIIIRENLFLVEINSLIDWIIEAVIIVVVMFIFNFITFYIFDRKDMKLVISRIKEIIIRGKNIQRQKTM